MVLLELTLMDWDAIALFYALIGGTPIIALMFKRPRNFVAHAYQSVKFFLTMIDPEHANNYQNVIETVKVLNKKHVEENSETVKRYADRIAELEAEKAANEKIGFEKLQSSFEKMSTRLELSLQKSAEHDEMLSAGKKEFGRLYKLVNQQGAILKKMEINQNRKAA